MSGSIRIQSRGESALQREQETVSGGETCRDQREVRSVTSYSMADRSMSTSSPFIRGIFFFLFLGKRSHRKMHLWRYNDSHQHKVSSVNKMKNTMTDIKGTLTSYIPPALGVTGDVVFEAVLLYLKHMVKGSIQFLHCHLNGTLQTPRLLILK